MSPFIRIHLRVNDSATQKPTPVRMRIASADGTVFAPFGHSTDFPIGRGEAVGGQVYLGGNKYVYIDGACEILLPTGVPLDIEISKGPLYATLHQTVTLKVGQMALRFELARELELQEMISWDARCHFITPHDALLEAAAEDLHLVQLLIAEQRFASQDGHSYRIAPNLAAFSGELHGLSENGRSVLINTFNVHPVLGSLALLNCHRPVFPLSFGGEEADDWSLCAWADQCRRKNGIVVWCDAYRRDAGLAGGEALIAAILGKVDALEISGHDRTQPLLPIYYRLLNSGVRMGLVGSSAKESNRTALGSMRTYTIVREGARTLPDWEEQTRSGATFVSNGPLLDLKVNGFRPGASLTSNGPSSIRVDATSVEPFDKLELIINGKVAIQTDASKLEIERLLPEGGWIAARCIGTQKSALDQQSPIFAHTSPVYVEVAGKIPFAFSSALHSWKDDIDQLREWIQTVGRFEQEKSRTLLLGLCNEAVETLALREATAATREG